MSLEARAVLHTKTPKGNQAISAWLFRRLPEDGKDTQDKVQIGVLGANDQQLTCEVSAVDLVNALKVIFPELTIS